MPLTLRRARGHALAALLTLAGGCAPPADGPTPDGAGEDRLVGMWRAVLSSPGGELPFTLEIARDGEHLGAAAINGLERAPFSGVRVEGERISLELAWYDAAIEGELVDGRSLVGAWRKVSPEGVSTLDFAAERDDRRRFLDLPTAEGTTDAPVDISGVWEVEFTDEDGTSPARGEFSQDGITVRGTFLTPTGDYRFLDGRYESGRLRLSTFDGAHAFLFTARATGEGELDGDFWSRDIYHATWRARRSATPTPLPEAWQSVGLTNDDGRFRFEFPDLDGRTLSSEDPRFDGKVVVVEIFGSWCPNCNDLAPLLAEWHRRWSADGLEVVGLAYEFSGDPERDARVVRRYAERHDIGFPLLLAGTSDKQLAGESLPDLTEVVAYPTTLFIGRDGEVARIHSGFAGPGTGRHYEELRESLEATIAELLAAS